MEAKAHKLKGRLVFMIPYYWWAWHTLFVMNFKSYWYKATYIPNLKSLAIVIIEICMFVQTDRHRVSIWVCRTCAISFCLMTLFMWLIYIFIVKIPAVIRVNCIRLQADLESFAVIQDWHDAPRLFFKCVQLDGYLCFSRGCGRAWGRLYGSVWVNWRGRGHGSSSCAWQVATNWQSTE